jgi:peptidoglycan/xylan/chitin deacetylase (PgdA/CDA1 family)
VSAVAAAGSTVVLMYHRVADEGPDPHALQVAPTRFARQLDVLRRRVEVVPLADVLSPGSSARAAITFDDGYRDNLLCAKPLLHDLGLPATVFVTSGYVGSEQGFWTDRLAALLLGGELPAAHLSVELMGVRLLIDVHTARARERAYRFVQRRLYPLDPDAIELALAALSAAAGTQPAVDRAALPMDVDQLRELARDGTITIGAHGVTHARLASLDTAAQRVELADSRRRLEELVGRAVPACAYPYGTVEAIDDTSVAIARELYDLAVTTVPDPVVATTDRHRIPRFNVGNWEADEFAARLSTWLGD